MAKSKELFKQAEKIFDSGDRSYKAFESLTALAEKAEGMEGEMIGDLISAFYADGGETVPPMEEE
jgi:hypothetical protein